MDTLSTIFLIGALFIIMTGMGLSLTLNDFKRVLKFPLAFFTGFVNQIVFLPLIAYLLIQFLNVNATVAIGIMILAACPGGATSNLLTHLAKGDTALSVSLTAVNSLITIITIPLIVNFGLSEFMSESTRINAPVGNIMTSLVIIIAIPLILGMLIKKFAPNFALKMDKPVRIASALVLFLVIVGILVKERDQIVEYFENALVITLGLNITTMLIGFLSAKIMRLNFKQALSICLESGNQNGTLAINIAVVSLARPDFAMAAAVYSLIMYPTAILPILIGNKQAKKEKEIKMA
ncbi:bile acid:sodium symporter family protein [Xanthovirga aplysinae]|uniref:bile acid:sodium symporter family protein n=1 Tax=Xanthovirga aplysinae TaxID=2529853 RepID=UPI0012BCDFCA|nr:bile acid:sodium symporter family protein [Xanthovirga aplysinae]MTI33274.1 bile acid:sodium symporter family protein [Xanthovirga aplysinae]